MGRADMYRIRLPQLVVVCVLLGMSLPASSMPVRNLDILSGEDFLSIFMQSATSTKTPPRLVEDVFTTLQPDSYKDSHYTERDEDSFTTKPGDDSHIEEKMVPTLYVEQEIISYSTEPEKSSYTTERTIPSHVTYLQESSLSLESDLSDYNTEKSMSSYSKEQDISSYTAERKISNQGKDLVKPNHNTDIKQSSREIVRSQPQHLLRGNSSYDKGRATIVQNLNTINLHSTRNEFTVDESDPVVRQSEKVKRKSEDLLAIGANPDYIAQQQSRLNRDNIQFQHPYSRQLSRSRSVSYSAVVQTPWKQNMTESTAESKDYYVTHKYNQNQEEFNDSLDKKEKKTYEPTERNWGLPEKPYGLPTVYGKPEENYEIDEAVSVITNGRIHGVQPTEKPVLKVGDEKDDNQKVGYVVEGRNFRKYRVEERTSDGFIVGEYGVVSNNDGSLRGVRYTADGTINPRVIYDALMKFLSL